MDNNKWDQVYSGVLIIGFGVLLLTGYWWPGIFYLLGGCMGAVALLKKEPAKKLVVPAIFIAIAAAASLNIPIDIFKSDSFWAAVIVVCGVAILVKAFSK